MRIITITTYQSMPWRYKVMHKGIGRPVTRDAIDSGEAAAIALNYIQLEPGDYVIVGEEKALSQIPAEIRTGRA